MVLLLPLCFIDAVSYLSEMLITVVSGSYLLFPASSLFSLFLFCFSSCFLQMPAEPGCLFPLRGEARRAAWELCGVGVISEGRASLKVAEVSYVLGGPNMAVSMGVSLGTGESPES